jgi:RNA polymerase sigma factor (sigma-70 family)
MRLTDQQSALVEKNNLRAFKNARVWEGSCNLSFDELLSCSFTGLTKAAAKFDPNRGAQFSTFAILCMNQEIYKAIEKENKRRAREVFYVFVVPGGDEYEDDHTEIEQLTIEDEHHFINKDYSNFLLNQLNEREAYLLEQIHFYEKKKMCIADELNITRHTVSRIYNKALEKLRADNRHEYMA